MLVAGTTPQNDAGTAFQPLPTAKKTWLTDVSDPARQTLLEKM